MRHELHPFRLVDGPRMTAGVWAVVTTFRPTEDAERAVRSVLDQVDGVIVVDDGSGAGAATALDRLRALGARVEEQPENLGIAAALNRGIEAAAAGGAERVVTFDQDSEVPAGFVAALCAVDDRARARGIRVGAVVPEHFARVRQAVGGFEDGIADAANVIQSGMLLRTDLLTGIGPMRADFFIDLVDTEFELRLRRHGYRILAAEGLALGHALGRKYRRELFGRPMNVPGIPPEVTLSTPFRYFYRVRNRIVLNREYFFVAPRQILRDSILDGIHFVNALMLARPRRDLWRLYRAGITAAIRGRMGRMPAPLAPVAQRIRWDAEEIDEQDL